MENIHYLGLAYLAIWLLLGYFGLTIFRKQGRISRDLAELKERLEQQGKK